MRFADPDTLLWLWILVPMIFLFWAMMSRKRKIMEKFAQPQLIPSLAANFNLQKYYTKLVLLTVFFFLSIVALARPQWGFEWQEIKRKGIDIIVVVDTSKSMLTEDVKPNRLERTKLGVKDLVKKLQGDRIGLIAFAGEAFMVCPLTVDYNGFLLTLEDLNTNTVPRGGTAVAKAIEEAINSYESIPSPHKVVIILTDGENLEGDPLKAAQEAKKKGVKIFCIGMGTQEGELVQIENEKSEKEFLKDEQGNFVKSRLNEDLLQKIAVVTGGAYVRASGAQFGLDLIYDRELSKMEKREIESKKEKKYFERFQIPLAAAIFFLMIESCMTTRGRKKEALRILLLGMLFATNLSTAAMAAPVFKDIHDGNMLYKEREYEGAMQKYQRAVEKQPNSDIINFNLGTVLYRLKKYPEALEHFQKSLLTDNKDLKAKTYFNLGDVYTRIGESLEDKDPDAAFKSIETAKENFEKVLSLNPNDKEAQFNLDYAKAELRRYEREKELKKFKTMKEGNESLDSQAKKEAETLQQQDGSQNKFYQPYSQKTENNLLKEGEEDKENIKKGEAKKNVDGLSPQDENRKNTLLQPDQEGKDRIEDNKGKNVIISSERLGKFTPEEVKKLLEQYQNSEEPTGLLNLQRGRFEEKPVIKDW